MLRTGTLITAAILLLLAAPGRAQTPTFSRADYPTSDAPRGIAAADFNRDGAMDLALVNTGRKSIAVLVNESTQGRGFVQRYEIVLGGGPFEVVAADMNNDSVVDLVVANADLNTIDVVLGRSTGGFEAPQHIAAAGFPRGVAVADLDGNGYKDIVYTQFDLDRVQILHGDTTGQFTARVAAMPTGPRPQGVVIGNFLACCRPDIAVTSTTTRVLSFFNQVDVATFQRSDVATPSGLNVLTTGDFNEDGRVDIAGVSTTSNNLVLFRAVGSGAWGYYGIFATGGSPRGIDAVDLNKDGRVDLVAANRTSSNVSVYIARADSSGWFAAPVTYPAGSGARDVVAGDFNMDGFADLATANEYGDSASVLINVVAAPAGPFWELRRLADGNSPVVEVANFNGNTAADLLLSSGVLLDGTKLVPLHSGGATPRSVMTGAAGDFNGDGRMDAATLVIFHDGTYPQTVVAQLYYGNGAGSFQYAGTFGSFNWVHAIDAADINRDGRTDLILATQTATGSEGRIEILLASDSGFTVQAGPSLISLPTDVHVADLDRNGTADLAVSSGYYTANSVQIFNGDGTGAFSAGERLAPPNSTIYRVRAVDVNRDAVLDIVGGGDSVVVWLGSSTGTYAAPQVYENDSFDLVIADVTGDGNPDVLSGYGSLMRGAANGTFSAPEPVNIWFQDAAPVDYDRDGRMDIVLVNYYHTMVLFSRAVRGPNLPPVAIAGPDYTRTFESQFDEQDCGGRGPSFDPNLDRLTFEWLDRNGRIVDSGEVLCPGVLPSGTHTFTLIVRDGHGGESSDSLTITIAPMKEVVVYAGYGEPHGAWQAAADTTAGGGYRAWHPDAGAAKLNAPLAAPANYVTIWLPVDPSQTYKLWMRMKGQNDSWANDSIFVQFANGVRVGGQTRYATGTTDALSINLEECSGCGLSGWGWRDERWGDTRTAAPVLLRFPNVWTQVQIQTREDGVSVDQIVLSAEKYLATAPGPAKRDTTILPPKPW